jgi:polyferredoxin
VCLVIGRALCGWACPIGLFQDIITRIRETFRFRSREMSLKNHDKMVGVKYAVLFIVIISALSIGISSMSDDLVSNLYIQHYPEGTARAAPYCQFCPTPIVYYISNVLFMGAPTLLTNWVNLAMLSIFIGFMVSATLIPRFWCRYFCPLGAFSSLFNKVSILSLRKDQDKCTRCNYCVNVCPTRVLKIKEEDKDDNVTDMNCDFCLECIENCPEKALSLCVGKKAIYKGGKKDWWQRNN